MSFEKRTDGVISKLKGENHGNSKSDGQKESSGIDPRYFGDGNRSSQKGKTYPGRSRKNQGHADDGNARQCGDLHDSAGNGAIEGINRDREDETIGLCNAETVRVIFLEVQMISYDIELNYIA